MIRKTPSIAYIKRLAKNIKKERGITHAKALNVVASNLGYSNWMHCQRSLAQASSPGQQMNAVKPIVAKQFQVSFTEWLKQHKNRNSPLGDLATDAIDDKSRPSYDSLEKYSWYLDSRGAISEAKETLKKAWKTYRLYLKKKNTISTGKSKNAKPVVKRHDPRKIVFVNGVSPLHFKSRTVELFNPSDTAWISWNGRKAIPVTILAVKDNHYTFRVERPLKKAGDEYFLFLDEVRSTPELACINHVTF